MLQKKKTAQNYLDYRQYNMKDIPKEDRNRY